MSSINVAFMAIAAVLYGLDKSLAPGAGILAVAFMAGAMPAKEATGVTLLMAIAGDWCAIWAYRKNVSMKTLVRLFPFVAIGIVCGAAFLFVADDAATKRTIGVILAVFVGVYFVNLARKRVREGAAGDAGADGVSADDAADAAAGAASGAVPAERAVDADATPAAGGTRPLGLAKRLVCGILAGFTTMVANVGGPVTSIYFLSEQLPVMTFLGTTAWFYLIINLVKLPFSLGLGMITSQAALSMLWTIPIILVTVLVGRRVARHVSQNVFSVVVYVLSVVAVVKLFL